MKRFAILFFFVATLANGQALIVTQQVVTTQVVVIPDYISVPVVELKPACTWHQFTSGDVADDCTYYVVSADMVAHGVTKAKLIDAPAPKRAPNAECTVVVSMIVDENGRSQHNEIAKHCGQGLDEAALAVTPYYKFEAATDQNGVSIATKVNIAVQFKAVK